MSQDVQRKDGVEVGGERKEREEVKSTVTDSREPPRKSMETIKEEEDASGETYDAELRRMLAFSLDMPPPVPPKDDKPLRSGANSPSTTRTPAGPNAPLSRTATPVGTNAPSRAATPTSGNPPSRAATPTGAVAPGATARPPRPTIAGTMTSGKPKRADGLPGGAVGLKQSVGLPSRPAPRNAPTTTAPTTTPTSTSTSTPTPTTPTKPMPVASPATSRSGSPTPQAPSPQPPMGATMSSAASWASSHTNVGMSPLKLVTTITTPSRAASKSVSVERSNTIMSEKSQGEAGIGWAPSNRTDAPDNLPRPGTSSTSTTYVEKATKYAGGKQGHTELMPQPSDDDEDPLNWPQWKKNLNLFAILFTTCLVNAMKTAFIPVSADMATRFDASQVEVAALTGVPLILSSLAGVAALTASKLWGKRPVYLASMLLLFIGSIWNMEAGSFGDCMGARVFQGFGWGAFDTLPLSSIHDTFFEHERGARLVAYDVLSALTTWGPPILSGFAARNSRGFTLHFRIINVFYLFSIPLLALAAPETAYDRWFSGNDSASPTTAPSSAMSSSGASFAPWKTSTTRLQLGRFTLRVPARVEVTRYLSTMSPVSSFRGHANSRTLLQAPRALTAPTTALLAVVTILATGSLWGATHVLSPLFAPALDDDSGDANNAAPHVGAILAAPWCFALLTIPVSVLVWRRANADFSVRAVVIAVGAAALLSFTGLIAFGLETYGTVSEESSDEGSGGSRDLSYGLLSFLLGLLAVGAYVMVCAARPVIWRSASYTCSNAHVCLRSVADMDAGLRAWTAFFAGVLVIGFANAAEASVRPDVMNEPVRGTGGLSDVVIGVGVAQLLVSGAAGATWWFWDGLVADWDGKVLGLVDLGTLGKDGSFFNLEE